jgi:hypothetical protein
MKFTGIALLSSSLAIASAHTLVRVGFRLLSDFNRLIFLTWACQSVYINGVDQGTGKGIRPPAFNGPPLSGSNPFGQGSGYQNSPVRDLTSPDMACNVLGDIPAPDTLDVVPGDVISFEWGHESRKEGDNVIESSHKGNSCSLDGVYGPNLG